MGTPGESSVLEVAIMATVFIGRRAVWIVDSRGGEPTQRRWMSCWRLGGG